MPVRLILTLIAGLLAHPAHDQDRCESPLIDPITVKKGYRFLQQTPGFFHMVALGLCLSNAHTQPKLSV